MQASTSQEIALLQRYEAWSQDVASTDKEYTLASYICCNGEDDTDLMRPEFALFLLNEHVAKSFPWSVLVWRAWLIWWTRAEQLHRWASTQEINAQGPVSTLIHCANANAWYKAWNWALEESPANVGQYLVPARERFSKAMDKIKQEKTVLRSIIQIAMKEEPWYETAKLVEHEKVII